MRRLSCAAVLGLIAISGACGGVSEPGPLDLEDDDTGAAASGGSSAGSGGSRAGGGAPAMVNGGASGREGMDPELDLENGGAGGATGGAGGSPAAGTGGGAGESGTGGSATGAGGAPSGNGGTGGGDAPAGGAGGDDPALGGAGGDTEQGGAGGQGGDTGQGGGGTGGAASGAGGTEDDPTTNGGTGGDEPGSGGTGGEVSQGGSGGQGGSAEPPPVVDVEVGECEPFEPCGGDVEGVWTYSAACVDLAALGLAEDDITAQCPNAELTLEGQVSGTLTFADGVVTRQGRSSAQGELFVPALCALALGGCAGVEDELAAASLDGADCAPQGAFLPSCRCEFELEAPALDAVPFVTEGDVLLLADGRELQYCVDGDSLTYQEIGTTLEPGVRQLERR